MNRFYVFMAALLGSPEETVTEAANFYYKDGNNFIFKDTNDFIFKEEVAV